MARKTGHNDMPEDWKRGAPSVLKMILRFLESARKFPSLQYS